MLPKMKKENLSVQLVNAITELIDNGTWRPKNKLPNEIELAASFDVSRNIMREAMKILNNFGILESKAGVGTFISEDAISNIHNMRFFNELKSNASVEKILETRLIIEPDLAYYACLRSSDEEIEDLAKKLIIISKDHKKEDFFHTDDFNFHARLAVLSGNDILANLLETLLHQLKQENYIRFNQYVSKEVKESSFNDHLRILEAVQKRDPLLARTIMQEHLFSRIKVIDSSYDTDLESSIIIAKKRKKKKI